jgi:predicted dehydrogenase
MPRSRSGGARSARCVISPATSPGSSARAATSAAPDGALAKVETGYIHPGRQPDNVVPAALTTKAIEVCGSDGALEIDFKAERLVWHRVRHTLHDDGFWRTVFGDVIMPKLEPRGPVEVVASELAEFLGHVAQRTIPEADAHRAGSTSRCYTRRS